MGAVMSYFDDNEDYIVYGRCSGRDYDEQLMYNHFADFDEDTAGWETEDGRYVLVKSAPTLHLHYALVKFSREGRGKNLCAAIRKELKNRPDPGKLLYSLPQRNQ